MVTSYRLQKKKYSQFRSEIHFQEGLEFLHPYCEEYTLPTPTSLLPSFCPTFSIQFPFPLSYPSPLSLNLPFLSLPHLSPSSPSLILNLISIPSLPPFTLLSLPNILPLPLPPSVWKQMVTEQERLSSPLLTQSGPQKS